MDEIRLDLINLVIIFGRLPLCMEVVEQGFRSSGPAPESRHKITADNRKGTDGRSENFKPGGQVERHEYLRILIVIRVFQRVVVIPLVLY